MEQLPHEHDEHCGCGHSEHQHEHGEGCGCGHDHAHHHAHSEGCGCGHEHGDHCGCHSYQGGIEGLSDQEADMLRLIGRYSCLPVARFALNSSKDDSLNMTAMAPVTIDQEDDSATTVRERGDILLSLEDKGLISLDYDIPINGYDYAGYRSSALFVQLEQAAAQAASQPGFLFDLPLLEGGSMALTDMGEMLLG